MTTATMGLMKAYVPTTVGWATRNNHAYAQKPVSDPMGDAQQPCVRPKTGERSDDDQVSQGRQGFIPHGRRSYVSDLPSRRADQTQQDTAAEQLQRHRKPHILVRWTSPRTERSDGPKHRTRHERQVCPGRRTPVRRRPPVNDGRISTATPRKPTATPASVSGSGLLPAGSHCMSTSHIGMVGDTGIRRLHRPTHETVPTNEHFLCQAPFGTFQFFLLRE
jgi:hypothetical protein